MARHRTMQESKKSKAALTKKWTDAKTAAAAKKKKIQDDYVARIKEIEKEFLHDIGKIEHREPSDDDETSESDLSEIGEEELRELTMGMYGDNEKIHTGFFKTTYIAAPLNSTGAHPDSTLKTETDHKDAVEDGVRVGVAKDTVQATGSQVLTDKVPLSPHPTEPGDESDDTIDGEPDDDYQNGYLDIEEPTVPPNRPITRSLTARASVEKSGNGGVDVVPGKNQKSILKVSQKDVQTAQQPSPVSEADQREVTIDEEVIVVDQEKLAADKQHMMKILKTLQMRNQISDLLFQAQEMFIQSQRVADDFVEYARFIGNGDERFDARSRFDGVLKRSIYEVGAVEWPSARKKRKQTLGGGNESKGDGQSKS